MSSAGAPAGGSPAPSRCSERASRPWPGGVPPVARGLTSGRPSYQPPSEPLSPTGTQLPTLPRCVGSRTRSRWWRAGREGSARHRRSGSPKREWPSWSAISTATPRVPSRPASRTPGGEPSTRVRHRRRSVGLGPHRRRPRELRRARSACTATPRRSDPDTVGRDSDVETVPLEVFDRTIAVNLRGHFLCTRLAIPHLSRRGGGAIVYTASAAAFIGEPVRPSYAIAKSGLTALARHVASRWGKEGIRAETRSRRA